MDAGNDRLYPQVVAGFEKRGVSSDRQHQLRLRDMGLDRPRIVTGSFNGQDQTFRTAGSEIADNFVVATEQVGGHAHHFIFQTQQAWKRQGVKRIFRQVHGVGLVGHIMDFFAGIINESEHSTGLPVQVLALIAF